MGFVLTQVRGAFATWILLVCRIVLCSPKVTKKNCKKNSRICHQDGGGGGEGRGETIFIQLLKTLYYRFYQDSNGRSFEALGGMAPGLLNPCATISDMQI